MAEIRPVMEKLYYYAYLYTCGYDLWDEYSAELNRLFLEDPENEEYLALEYMREKEAALHLMARMERERDYDPKRLGYLIMSFLSELYGKNIYTIEEFGRRASKVCFGLPEEIWRREPLISVAVADECLAWSDEAQCRNIYEAAFKMSEDEFYTLFDSSSGTAMSGQASDKFTQYALKETEARKYYPKWTFHRKTSLIERRLTIGLIIGILMSAVFLLLVPYSYGYLDKDKAVSVNGIFASFELNYDHNDPSRHIKGVSLNFEDIDRMFINYAWSDELIERLRTVEPGTRMRLLIRPNSHEIMSIEADGKTILAYESSQEANLKQVRGFRWLGIFMLFCSGLFGWKLYKNISVV